MKQLQSFLYTKGKYVPETREIVDEDGKYLCAEGKYPTDITRKDLPEDYVEFVSGSIQYRTGYLKTSGIRDVRYHGSRNHQLYRDDYIYLSYRGEITHDVLDYDYEGFPDYDISICGRSIFPILDAVEKNSGLDIRRIRQEIQTKQAWFKQHYPKEYKEILKTEGRA